MMLMAIGKATEIWAAAVEEYGIIDWYTMLQHSDPLLREYEKSLLGDPVKDRVKYELHRRFSSCARSEHRCSSCRVSATSGAREEAAQVVDILKKEGRTVDAVYYPQEGHGFMKREDQIDEITRMVAWFDKYLKGAH